MALLFPVVRPPNTGSTGVRDRAVATALRSLESWATEVTGLLSRADVTAGGGAVGGVASVTAGANMVVAPNTGAVVVALAATVSLTNATVAGNLTISGFTPGSVLFAGTGGLVSQDNAGLFWHDASNYLTVVSSMRVGAAIAPSVRLNVTGPGGESGTAAEAGTLVYLENSGNNVLLSMHSTTNRKKIAFGNSSAVNDGFIDYDAVARGMRLATASTVRLTIDSSGHATFENNLACNGAATLGNATGDIHTVNGTIIQASAQGGGVPALGVTNTGAAVANSYSAIRGRVDGSFDATAGNRTNDGVIGVAFSTRSAGSNNVINRAVFADAVSGQLNYAFYGDRGDNLFNVTSGSTGVGYALGATLPKKLSVTGDVYVSTELEVDGAFNHDGTTIGLFSTAPTTQQTVTGSRGGNAALASLLTALAAYGLIVDSTTA